jgi:hypothetical protein
MNKSFRHNKISSVLKKLGSYVSKVEIKLFHPHSPPTTFQITAYFSISARKSSFLTIKPSQPGVLKKEVSFQDLRTVTSQRLSSSHCLTGGSIDSPVVCNRAI